MVAEHVLEEIAGQLIVLLIRLCSVEGNGARLESRDQLHQMLLLRLWIAFVFLPEALRQHPSDAEAYDNIGEQVADQKLHGQRQGFIGGRGLDGYCGGHEALVQIDLTGVETTEAFAPGIAAAARENIGRSILYKV